MKLQSKRRTSVAAIALALAGTGAYAITPLDDSGRGYHASESAEMARDDSGNDVRSRDFSDTRQLESSGRGSALSKEGSSAAQQEQENLSAAGSTWSGSSNPSIDGQAAASHDLNATVDSAVMGSGYTRDADLVAGSDDYPVYAQSGVGPQDQRLVVIVPENWDGSVPQLVAALEAASDERAIVIVESEQTGAMPEGDPSIVQ